MIDRLRPQLAKITGVNLFLQPAQDITVGGRISRAAFQYTLQDPNVAELNEWSKKLLDKMRTLPELTDVASDLLASAPQLKVTINRDQASRFGISPQAIDDTLNDAYGQRQIAQYFTQLNTYWLILEIPPDLQQSLASLDSIYVKSPLTGAAVPLSALVDTDAYKVGPLSINHQGQFPAATLSFNLRAGIALGEAVEAIGKAVQEIGMPSAVIGTFQGNAQAFQSSLSSEPALIAAALVVVYIILGMLYESFIHPLTILSTLPSAGIGALLALQLGHMDLSVSRYHRPDLYSDWHRQEERHHDGGLRHCGGARAQHVADRGHSRSSGLAAVILSDPDDDGSGSAGRRSHDVRRWYRLGTAQAVGAIPWWADWLWSQILTLYTTPVVYLYLARLQAWVQGKKIEHLPRAEEIHAIAAE